jgi:hypothetical protein
MKKVLLALLGVGILASLMGGVALAKGPGAGWKGMWYNPEVYNKPQSEFDGGDTAFVCMWTEHPWTVIRAEEFDFHKINGKWETELTQVEARIKSRLDDILIKK